MSSRRLLSVFTVPELIKQAFRAAAPPVIDEERLWRERAARMTLDALGHTNLTIKPRVHRESVGYARRWFKQFYADQTDPALVDNAEATFDEAGVAFETVRDIVLDTPPVIALHEEQPDGFSTMTLDNLCDLVETKTLPRELIWTCRALILTRLSGDITNEDEDGLVRAAKLLGLEAPQI